LTAIKALCLTVTKTDALLAVICIYYVQRYFTLIILLATVSRDYGILPNPHTDHILS